MNKIVFILGIFFTTLCVQDSNAQLLRLSNSERAEQNYQRAIGFMQDRDMDRAMLSLNRAIELDSTHTEALELISNLYYRKNDLENTMKYLELLIKADPKNTRAKYNYADLLEVNGKYYKALALYKEVAGFEGLTDRDRDVLRRKIELSQFRINLVENPVPFEPENVGPAINSRHNEYWPALTADESTLYFTRGIFLGQDPERDIDYSRSMNIREDIFVSYRKNKDGEWQEAVGPPGNLNSKYNEGAISLTPDGRYLYFAGCNRPDGFGGCDIYVSEFRNGRWSNPKNLGPPINTRAQETQPSISYDGNTLYFSSTRSGGKGGYDLWKSTKDENGNWQRPVNLGPKINTSGDEQAPFIHPDDHTLYFSSNGHPGLGSSDIFYSRRNAQGEFDTAINMGYPINNHEDQFALIVSRSGNTAYFASEAEPSEGGLDLFKFELYEEARPLITTYIQGTVSNKYSHNKLEAKLEIRDLNTGEVVLITYSDGSSGEYLASLPANRDYVINVSKSGYLFYSDNFSLKEHPSSDPFIKDIKLVPIRVGESVVLNNVFFDFDKYELRPESKTELDILANFLKSNPAIKIEIGGHTDSRGGTAYNMELSENRAKSVKAYLVNEAGIGRNRITAKGYGESKPIADNETEAGRQLNRRTEFKILEN